MKSRSHRVGILIFEGVKMLDIAGPAEVFTEANELGADYRISLVTPDGNSVASSIGMHVSPDASAAGQQGYDTLLVAGGDGLVGASVPPDLLRAASDLAHTASRVASVCTGAFILGAAGLLRNRRATTHWRHTAELVRRHPDTEVLSGVAYVKDEAVFTSAGASTGIALGLALIGEDYGLELSRAVSSSLKAGTRPAEPDLLDSTADSGWGRSTSSAVRAIVELVEQDPAHPYTVPGLARHVNVSPRHLSRMFRTELGISPGRFVERVRLEHAKSLLRGERTVTMAAQLSGFGSPESLRRALHDDIGVAPSTYRARFRDGGRSAL